MLRSLSVINTKASKYIPIYISKQTFLTNDYYCNEAWKEQAKSSLMENLNLNDFYNVLDQKYTTKGTISSVDVDIFANAIKDPIYLDELRDLLHKLRLSAETGTMLESTHQATIRNYLKFGNIQELINILKDPLNYGLFLDNYTANILLNELITSSNIDLAANVASLVMLQEEYNNEITCGLCQYACFKYVMGYTKPQKPAIVEDKKKKVEEIKIRIKFLRNPYFDDHFDIQDLYTLSGKTLTWISERSSDNLNINLQMIGLLSYRKYEKLLKLCMHHASTSTLTLFSEVLDLIKKDINNVDDDSKEILTNILSVLTKFSQTNASLEESIKTMIENAINRNQNKDIEKQNQLFQVWSITRQQRLDEQTERLNRAKRLEDINRSQEQLKIEEQKLWFFDNEDNIDLVIEEKEQRNTNTSKTKSIHKADEDYIPPEILPKRK
ncbi:hypothetical protein ACJJTC_011178 [Scirpophaga incertulas]